jgi:predicted GIY-YIG superfamily endonuclease
LGARSRSTPMAPRKHCHEWYYVYILASHTGTLYIGVTNSIERRIFEHKQRRTPGFASKYEVDRLLYYERFGRYPRCNCSRETVERMAPREEDCALRESEPQLGRSQPGLVRSTPVSAEGDDFGAIGVLRLRAPKTGAHSAQHDRRLLFVATLGLHNRYSSQTQACGPWALHRILRPYSEAPLTVSK